MPDLDEVGFENGYLGAPKALSLIEELEAIEAERDGETEADKRMQLPQAIDLCVPPGKSSVVLTGPNTGKSL